MKGKRLKDVLDEKVFDRDFWQKMFAKKQCKKVLKKRLYKNYFF